MNEIVSKYQFSEKQVKSVLELLEENNTVPFIARYRKKQRVVWMKFKSNKFLTNINMLQIYRKEKMKLYIILNNRIINK